MNKKREPIPAQPADHFGMTIEHDETGSRYRIVTPAVYADAADLLPFIMPACPQCETPILGLWSLPYATPAAGETWTCTPAICGFCETPIVIVRHVGPWYFAMPEGRAVESHMPILHVDRLPNVGEIPTPIQPACPYCGRLFDQAALDRLPWDRDALGQQDSNHMACNHCRNIIMIRRITAPWYTIAEDPEFLPSRPE